MRNSFEALLREVAELRALKLAVHDLAVARLEGVNATAANAIWRHDMTEIERLTR